MDKMYEVHITDKDNFMDKMYEVQRHALPYFTRHGDTALAVPIRHHTERNGLGKWYVSLLEGINPPIE